MSETPNLPEFVKQRMQQISEKKNIPMEEILHEYMTIFNDPFVQSDPQFKSDSDRHMYALRILIGRLLFRPPVKEFEVVPIGIRGKRITKKGMALSVVYALVRDNMGARLRRIIMRNSDADNYKNITLFAKYRVKLALFNPNDQQGDLLADYRAKWSNPQLLTIEPIELLEQKLGFKRITISEVPNNLSRITSVGYVDDMDWRIIRGVIVRKASGKRDDGTEWGVYAIIDETMTDVEETVTEDGRVIYGGFSVWLDPMLMEFDVESECDFAGIVRQTTSGDYSMEAFVVLPVHARQIEI